MTGETSLAADAPVALTSQRLLAVATWRFRFALPRSPYCPEAAFPVVEIRANGRIDEHWSPWFEGLTITQTDEGETFSGGELANQAALYRLLGKLRDVYLSLVSVKHVGLDLPRETWRGPWHRPWSVEDGRGEGGSLPSSRCCLGARAR